MRASGIFFLYLVSLVLTESDKTRNLTNNDNILKESTANQAIPILPSLLPKSRLLNSGSLINGLSHGSGGPSQQSAQARIHYESYKALVGETVRLECPQPNPTWFFRRTNKDSLHFPISNNEGTEDLIVTRHGIINADYKYKIMCHVTLKHKVIVVNNIDFDDEGLYTCLYTIANEKSKTALLSSSGSGYNEPTVILSNDNNPIQYRYVFNVTVYTLISGLTMNFKLGTVKPTSSSTNQLNSYKKYKHDQFNELVENSITIRENDEFWINCVVDNSRPVADIKFSLTQQNSNTQTEILSLNNNNLNSYLTLPPTSSSNSYHFLNLQPNSPQSAIVSTDIKVVKNNDQTYKTILTARLKPTQEDHGKVIGCKAENGFSNQKWENKKILNVLFPPVCKDPPKFTYYVGINQTINIECRIQNANPNHVTFDWNLDNILTSDLPIPSQGSFLKSEDIEDDYLISSFNKQPMPQISNYQMPYGNMINVPNSYSQNSNIPNSKNGNNKMTAMVNDGFTSSFKWRPNSMNDFGEVKCKVTNEIGSTECIYEIKLGGVPNPPTDCSYTLKNTSAIISCQVGFHQGDPDIYCYLLRKSDNGVYKEHTRNRESCSFIVNDVNVNKLNEFWIYSSNKHGHNKDVGVYLTIGQNAIQMEQTSNKNYIVIGIIASLLVFTIVLCCFCYKLRKGMSDDSDSIFDNNDPAYQSKSNLTKKSNHDYTPPPKIIKGMKENSNGNAYDPMNESFKEQKYIKLEMSKSIANEYENDNKKMMESQKVENYMSLRNEDYFDATSNKKIKKYSFFKSTTNTTNSISSSPDDITNKNIVAIGNLMRNSLNNNNNNSLKKSLSKNSHNVDNSTTNSSENSSFNEETNKLIKESSYKIALNKNLSSSTSSNGLLTTVENMKSLNSLNDSNLSNNNNNNNSNKMVTFSQQNNNFNKKANKNNATPNNQSSINLTTNNNPSITTTTTSASASSTSPTVSSIDSPPTPIDESFNENTTLTVSDQSYSHLQQNLNNKLSRPTKLTTFGASSNSETNRNDYYKTPKKFINTNADSKKLKSTVSSENQSQQPPSLPSSVLYSNGIQNEFADSFEAKYLNKLCEDIEVSLNVDCECADDYSSNDFSGDYSFDHDFKPYPLATKTSYTSNQSSNPGVNPVLKSTNSSNLAGDLRKKYDSSAKTANRLANSATITQQNYSKIGQNNNKTNKMNNSNSSNSGSSSGQTGLDSASSSQLGVLV